MIKRGYQKENRKKVTWRNDLGNTLTATTTTKKKRKRNEK